MGARAIAYALAAAGLFGLSTPAAKLLLGVTDPFLLAGLLYLGSGLGLGLARAVTSVGQRRRETPLQRADAPWLLGAIVSGGALGPVLLLSGLAATPASQASLLLNHEGTLTMALRPEGDGWVIVAEHFSFPSTM